MRHLRWRFSNGEWVSTDGDCITWVIGVCDDGTFDVSESEPFTKAMPCFPTLQAAKEFCETYTEEPK